MVSFEKFNCKELLNVQNILKYFLNRQNNLTLFTK